MLHALLRVHPDEDADVESPKPLTSHVGIGGEESRPEIVPESRRKEDPRVAEVEQWTKIYTILREDTEGATG